MRQLRRRHADEGAPALEFGVVDVRDVARAHIKAGYTPEAHGRHIAVAESMTMLEHRPRAARPTSASRYPFPQPRLPKR